MEKFVGFTPAECDAYAEQATILILTAADVEREAVAARMKNLPGKSALVYSKIGYPHYVGIIGKHLVVHYHLLDQRSDYVSHTLNEARRTWPHIAVVVMVGMLFGLHSCRYDKMSRKSHGQMLNDIVVATSVQELTSKGLSEPMKTNPMVCQSLEHAAANYMDGKKLRVYFGSVVVVSEVLRNREERDEVRRSIGMAGDYPKIIAGEMEGSALYMAQRFYDEIGQKNIRVMLIKAISDWGFDKPAYDEIGRKKHERYRVAASAEAAAFLEYVLNDDKPFSAFVDTAAFDPNHRSTLQAPNNTLELTPGDLTFLYKLQTVEPDLLPEQLKNAGEILEWLRGAGKFACVNGVSGIGKTITTKAAVKAFLFEPATLPQIVGVRIDCNNLVTNTIEGTEEAGRKTYETLVESLSELTAQAATKDARDQVSYILKSYRRGVLLVFEGFEHVLNQDTAEVLNKDLQNFLVSCMNSSDNIRILATTQIVPNSGDLPVIPKKISIDRMSDESGAELFRRLDGERRYVYCKSDADLLALPKLSKSLGGVPRIINRAAAEMDDQKITALELLKNEELQRSIANLDIDELLDPKLRFILFIAAAMNDPVRKADVIQVAKLLQINKSVSTHFNRLQALHWLEGASQADTYSMPSLVREQVVKSLLHNEDERIRIYSAVAEFYDNAIYDEVSGKPPQVAGFLYESAEFSRIVSGWLRALVFVGSEKRHVSLANRFFETFWWWEEYVEGYEACEIILKGAADACRLTKNDTVDDELVKRMQIIYYKWPRASKWKENRLHKHRSTWKMLEQTLSAIRDALPKTAIAGDVQLQSALGFIRTMRGTCLASMGSSEAVAELTAAYDELGDPSLNQWAAPYALYDLADFYLLTPELPDIVRAAQQIKPMLDYVQQGNDMRDDNVDVYAYRLCGDILSADGDYAHAFEARRVAVYRGFQYLIDKAHTEKCDPYTIALYTEVRERFAADLRKLYKEGREDDIWGEAEVTRDQWKQYWCYPAAGDDGTPVPLGRSEWLRLFESDDTDAEIMDHLSPAVPDIAREEEHDTADALFRKIEKITSAMTRDMSAAQAKIESLVEQIGKRDAP